MPGVPSTKHLDTWGRGEVAPGQQHQLQERVTRPSQSSSNYDSDTHSHKQTPDTSCLFLDWKSLFLPTQVVRLEHAEHRQSQQPYVQPSPKGQCQQPSGHPLDDFLVISALLRWKRMRDFWIASEGTRRSSPDTHAQGVNSPSVACLLWWPALSSLLSSSVTMFSNTHSET